MSSVLKVGDKYKLPETEEVFTVESFDGSTIQLISKIGAYMSLSHNQFKEKQFRKVSR